MPQYFDEVEPANLENGIQAYTNSPLKSLEEATRPVVQFVYNLEGYVAIAKQRCLTKSPHGLTHDESAAIYLYTMEMETESVYHIVNRLLRTNNAFNALPWFLYLKLLWTGVKKLPAQTGNVWRGVRGDIARRYKKSAAVCWWGFTSCSKDLSVLKNFLPSTGNATVFMIECINGKAISAYSQYRDENEILLMPGERLVAADDSLPTHGLRVVHLKQMSTEITSNQLIRAMSSINLGSSAKPNIYPTSPKTPIPNKKEPFDIHSPPKSMLASKNPTIPAAHNLKKEVRCPHCGTNLTWTENNVGQRVICHQCKQNFNEITCPCCHRSNIFKNSDYKSGLTYTCASCSVKFQHLNCPHCHKAMFWHSKNHHTSGLRTTCSACHNAYHCINCPNCRVPQYFKDNNYKAGLRYKCSSCKHFYQHINCPHCSKPNIWKNADRKEGCKTNCSKCKNVYQHINCPECSEANVWDKANRTPGAKVTCWKCNTIFQHINCPHCNASHFWRHGNYIPGQRVSCLECNRPFQHLICTHCQQANYFFSADHTGGRVRCCKCNDIF